MLQISTGSARCEFGASPCYCVLGSRSCTDVLDATKGQYTVVFTTDLENFAFIPIGVRTFCLAGLRWLGSESSLAVSEVLFFV